MPVTCSHKAPNQESSILYASLVVSHGEDQADAIWNIIRTKEFKNQYGDWERVPAPAPVDPAIAIVAERDKAILQALVPTNTFTFIPESQVPTIEQEIMGKKGKVLRVETVPNTAFIQEQARIKEEYKELTKLINCLTHI